jgi:hypothetical protein
MIIGLGPPARQRWFVCASLALAIVTSCSAALPLEPRQSPAATFAAPLTWASACGAVTDRVPRTDPAGASFVLRSPGRAPLRISWRDPAPIDSFGGDYVCVLLEAGVPSPIFAGQTAAGLPGFVPEGTVPATAAQPSPPAFVLPQACAFVAPPLVDPDSIVWRYDCGAEATRDARGALRTAFGQQGWTSCGPALATERWTKFGVALSVAESSLVPGDYPKLTQFTRLAAAC